MPEQASDSFMLIDDKDLIDLLSSVQTLIHSRSLLVICYMLSRSDPDPDPVVTLQMLTLVLMPMELSSS